MWAVNFPFLRFLAVDIKPVDHLKILRSLIDRNDTLLCSRHDLHFQILRVPFDTGTSLNPASRRQTWHTGAITGAPA
jgi:hypothetical protein